MHTCQQDKFTEIASSFKALRHDDQKLASALVEKQGEALSKEFEVKDLGSLRYFLVMEVTRSSKDIFISQHKHTLDLLKETVMLGCRPASTPMDPKRKLGIEEEEVLVDKGRYQRLVGMLIYLSHTHLDIGFAVSMTVPNEVLDYDAFTYFLYVGDHLLLIHHIHNLILYRKTDSFFPLDETEVVKTESILNIKYGIEGDRAVGAHIPVNIKPEGQDELLFKIALPLQRPVLDPCLAVGFLPFTFDCLRVGQLVDMKWRLERLKDPEEIQSFLSKDELLYEIDANPENWMIAGRKRGHISLAATQGSRVVITVSCLPLVSGYVRPPQLGLPGVAESNISCNPAGPHLVCVLPPTLSSSFCVPA
ncbi:trafficking protein particle complex II-specific subunit 130 homolog [Dendrobium catenatum]|uniref:trafficking protein particle complex II-specific subunit 130 homolog n=1 Tax=Dendrobium catenatum TaxID=906689 RepID=UPI0009F41EE5|nr:trafficking protein particle complex II-specific subunit 130 homolog [Dendrobium catenatum]